MKQPPLNHQGSSYIDWKKTFPKSQFEKDRAKQKKIYFPQFVNHKNICLYDIDAKKWHSYKQASICYECCKQSVGGEAELIALFTFRDTSFSSNGPIKCESIWDHFFCMRRSFLFCLTHANTRTWFCIFWLKHKQFQNVVISFHAAFKRLCCLPVEDECNGRNHHHTHAQNNHNYGFHADACK